MVDLPRSSTTALYINAPSVDVPPVDVPPVEEALANN
tara:strand:- start:446 stop:556 length:111 start_codon:yes stop_codon:yes gene_type:complete